jgi:rhodanese-related sulfurtransferase
VSLEELEGMIENENVLLLDVRPSIEYVFGHITGAVSVPVNELMAKLKDFSKKKEIIAYCRGPFCVLADEVVKILNEQGYKARRLNDGYPELKMSQLETN